MNTTQTKVIKKLHRILETVGRLFSSGSTMLDMLEKEIAPDLDDRISDVAKSIGTDGIDPFGLDPATLRRTALGAAFLYRHYFRCIATGVENVPDGPVIIVANHGGQLPIDGLMITTALLLERTRPRLARSMMDHWVPTLPFVSTFFSRVGVALGTPENALRLLEQNAALLTFPEGMAGITKTVDKAYQLQEFSPGFMRLALSAKVPIVPVAVVGCEEQYPTLYNLEGAAKLLGLPALPIWAQMIIPVLGILPLPVKYYLDFTEPMYFEGDPDDRDAVIDMKVEEIKSRIKDHLDPLKAKRKSVFF